MTLEKSNRGSDASSPYRSAARTLWATVAAFSSALLGTHPVQVQSPPSLHSSIRAVFAPNEAESPAAVSPAAPPPITAMSKSIGIVTLPGHGHMMECPNCENLYHATP